MNFSKAELVLILDGLSMLPLKQSYNLFQKVLAEHNKPEPVKPEPEPVKSYGGNDE